jgi:hypothetical protein
MTSTTDKQGRLGNQIIRNLAVSVIAQKHDLKVSYSSKKNIDDLGIKLYSGTNVHKKTNKLHDDNFFEVYNSSDIDYNLGPNGNFFQSQSIIKVLYEHLQSDEVKSNIMECNPYKDRYNNNNDLYIHVRLGDVEKFNPGIQYYKKAIEMNKFDNVHISTDSKCHRIIKELLKKYPNASLIEYNEVNTIQFASTCKNVILSHGSFSAIIGYLSYFSTVYYPKYRIGGKQMWHGDMFSIDGWNEIDL